MTVKILENSSCTYSAVGDLHKSSISLGFISSLSPSFLAVLYTAIGNSPYSTVIVAVDSELNNKVLGFVAGSVHLKKMYRHICIRNFFKLTMCIIPDVLNFKRLYKAIETFVYGFINSNTAAKKDVSVTDISIKTTKEKIVTELLSIAVSVEARGQGIGRMLIRHLEEYFQKKKVHSYKVVTVASDCGSNTFYRSCGFSFSRQFLHHDNTMNEYMKDITS